MFSKECGRVIDFVNTRQFFCVIGHESPDLDCLCSQLALASFLKHLGKDVVLSSWGPFSRNDVRYLEYLFQSHLPLDRLDHDNAGVILVDCASLSRTGFGNVPCACVAIDHHACVEEGSLSGYIDAQSPAATLLVYRLMRSMNHVPSKEEVEWLMLGFCADTGFFRHLSPKAAPYMNDVGEMLARGISIEQVYEKMEGRFSLTSRQYIGKLIAGCQAYAQNRLIMIVEESWDATIDRDAASIYRLLLSVENVEVVMIMRRKDDGYSVGLRSRNDVDVGCLAGHFGGGGHAKAAGFFTTSTPETVREFFVDILNNRDS